MAIKDWKKETELFEGTQIDAWYNKHTGQGLFITQQINEWNVSMTKPYADKIGGKNFKTKPQALRYARKYMKTH